MSATAARLRRAALAAELTTLCNRARQMETLHRASLVPVREEHRASAANLLHYLALRQVDLRPLQRRLAALGVSSLGRTEGHVMASLVAVLRNLVPEQRPLAEQIAQIGFQQADQLLSRNRRRLLGHTGERPPIMVTMPSHAARDPLFVQALLEAGMTIMRINCAHDAPTDWQAMVEHLATARRNTGLFCRVQCDLPGPKLRTGQLYGPAVRFKVRRQPGSAVARFKLIETAPSDAGAAQPPCVVIERGKLKGVRAGDHLMVTDRRGKRRHARVEAVTPSGFLMEARKSILIGEGVEWQLMERGGATAASARTLSCPADAASVKLRAGDRILLTRDRAPVVWDHPTAIVAAVECPVADLFARIEAGQAIWFDDGHIGGRVVAVGVNRITVEITSPPDRRVKLRAGKGINLPETTLASSALSDEDHVVLPHIARYADLIGESFVQNPADVLALGAALSELGAGDRGIILKIETRRAFENLPRLLLAGLQLPCVGVMVARGDLAVEVGYERLAEVQEEILWLCEAAHVPVIWATQVLDNLTRHGTPSRPEVTDAAMAARADCVMLNKGPHILESLRFLRSVLERMDAHQHKKSAMLRALSVATLPTEPPLPSGEVKVDQPTSAQPPE